MIGERKVGKSSLVHKYVLDQFSDSYFATLGMKVYKKIVYVVPPRSKEAIPVTMTIWDVMGDSDFVQSMKKIYLYGASGIIAVGTITDSESVIPLNRWLESTKRFIGDVPTQIVLNKWDTGEDEKAKRIGTGLAKRHVAPCYLASACKGDNIERAFGDLAHRILAQSMITRAASEDKIVEVLVSTIGETKSLEDLSNDFGMSAVQVEPKIRELVRVGRLTLESIELSSDGLPIMRFTATGKLLRKSKSNGHLIEKMKVTI